jgi:hypothetical protein
MNLGHIEIVDHNNPEFSKMLNFKLDMEWTPNDMLKIGSINQK